MLNGFKSFRVENTNVQKFEVSLNIKEEYQYGQTIELQGKG